MSDIPYSTKIYCPISDMEEDVFFYEVNLGGKWHLEFKGCDHNWSKRNECDVCQKEAYDKMITEYRARNE